MKSVIGKLLLLALLAAAVSFVIAPGVAFLGIRSAADSNDVAALNRLIDFGAVRQSLRAQLSGRPEAIAPAPSFMEDPIGAFRRQIEDHTPIRMGPNVEAYLTPAALGALTRGEGRYAAQRTTTPADPENPFPSPVYWGVNSARLAVTDDGGSRTTFTFERRGPFEWKLAHIGLPEGAAPAAPAPATAPAASR